MTFDWCRYELLKHECCDYEQDHCEGCNVLEAYLHGYKTGLKDASPSVWILFSDGKPPNGKKIIITADQDGRRYVTSAFYEKEGHFTDDEGLIICFDYDVVAWMPLPEEYKG